jgi:integrase/recombinase XerD
VPILPELDQALRTHLGNCTVGCLFETIHHTPFSSRRIQQIIKKTADEAKITKQVYPHLLRHSVATALLERGMPIEQIQKFLGHRKLETTQIYAESSPDMFKESHSERWRGEQGRVRGKVRRLTPLNQNLGVESGFQDGRHHHGPHSRIDRLCR